MDMYDDDEYVKKLFAYCKEVGKRIAEFYIDAGMDVIAVVDPLVSQISSDYFEEFLENSYTELFQVIKEKGAFTAFFVCGNATRNIEPMCKTAPDSICVDENVDLLSAKEITDRYNIAIGGNIPLTTIMLHGTQQDNMKYIIDLLDSTKTMKNLIIAPGCDMPYDVPVENTIAVVLQTDQVREILKNYVAVRDDIKVELPIMSILQNLWWRFSHWIRQRVLLAPI